MMETRHNPDQSRYEALIDGVVAGFAVYQLTDEIIAFTHTEVDPAYERRGVASAIARFALDDVRRDGSRHVLPLCPFIKEWISRHPDYFDLVYDAPTTTAKD
jgi:predicted GNAT family acetyltransferase